MQSICTAHAKHMHSTCKAYAQHMQSICTAHAKHMHSTCKAYAQHMQSICTHTSCIQTAATALHTATSKTKHQNLTSPPPSGDACPHTWPSLSGLEIGQGSGTIGQMGRGFPVDLKQAIPYPFNKVFINPHMTTMHPAVIQHPFNLKFTCIVCRRIKTRIKYRIPRITNSRFQLTGMKNRM